MDPSEVGPSVHQVKKIHMYDVAANRFELFIFSGRKIRILGLVWNKLVYFGLHPESQKTVWDIFQLCVAPISKPDQPIGITRDTIDTFLSL